MRALLLLLPVVVVLCTAVVAEATTVYNRVVNSFGSTASVNCMSDRVADSEWAATLLDGESYSWTYDDSIQFYCNIPSSQEESCGSTRSFNASWPALYAGYDYNYVLFMRGDGLYLSPATDTHNLTLVQSYGTGFLWF